MIERVMNQEDFVHAVGWALWYMHVWPKAKVTMVWMNKSWNVFCNH